MKRAGFWRLILTRPHGRMMHWPSWRSVLRGRYQHTWNGRDPALALHVWIFFDRATSAPLARKLGVAMLTRTMERRHQIGLDSYDRLFPNQDTMPQGGFGNLIALPLQRGPRKEGNSVFIDRHFRPFPDLWRFLSSVKRFFGAGERNRTRC
jgi:hypothetical protein